MKKMVLYQPLCLHHIINKTLMMSKRRMGNWNNQNQSTGFITVKDVFCTGSKNELPKTECHRSFTSLNIKDDKLNRRKLAKQEELHF
uniref:Uncharacterized protein n=1 Tax=Wuchereria bancrofti TaxID=6293 RepID=A0A1I8EM57_WUCBA